MLKQRKWDIFKLAAVFFVSSSLAWGQWAQWTPHTVRQLNGRAGQINLPGKFQVITEPWYGIDYQPYLVYMPEKGRLLLMASYRTLLNKRARTGYVVEVTSSDLGATWSKRRYVHTDPTTGKPDVVGVGGLTYLGKGKLLFHSHESLWASHDYGETWSKFASLPPISKGMSFNDIFPWWVDKDPQTGKVIRLTAVGAGWLPGALWDGPRPWTQGYIRFSQDEGRTWSKAIKVPEWLDTVEPTVVRAKNGNLVAALRTIWPKRFDKMQLDSYCGLAVSISKDNGRTWSKLNRLYSWGRHHPSLVVLPDGDIVLTYVVRKGYPYLPAEPTLLGTASQGEGYPQFGIEAVVSHDNGETWDLDHRYLLITWRGLNKGPNSFIAGPNQDSTVLLPDGSLLTAYGTGYRTVISNGLNPYTFRDVALVSWRLNPGPVNSDRTIAQAPFDSNLRNEINPNPPVKPQINIALPSFGARVRSTTSDENPNLVLDNRYWQPVVTLKTIPAWVEISWPREHRIDEIRIHAGAPCFPGWPIGIDAKSTPMDYRLQYRKGGKWVDLTAPVRNAESYVAFRKVWPQEEFQYVHKFAPVKVKTIRLLITQTGDPGTRKGTGKKVVVPEDKRQTVLRKIEVFEAK